MADVENAPIKMPANKGIEELVEKAGGTVRDDAKADLSSIFDPYVLEKSDVIGAFVEEERKLVAAQIQEYADSTGDDTTIAFAKGLSHPTGFLDAYRQLLGIAPKGGKLERSLKDAGKYLNSKYSKILSRGEKLASECGVELMDAVRDKGFRDEAYKAFFFRFNRARMMKKEYELSVDMIRAMAHDMPETASKIPDGDYIQGIFDIVKSYAKDRFKNPDTFDPARMPAQPGKAPYKMAA